MADLALEALDFWDRLEKDSGTSLRLMSGLLNFGDKNYGGNTPEGKCFFVMATTRQLIDSIPTGTLLGPIANLERLGMSYKKCKLAL